MQNVSISGSPTASAFSNSSAVTTSRKKPTLVPSGSTFTQTTLASSIHCNGIGLHSGQNVTLSLNPGPANSGIRFHRTDRPDSAPFTVTADSIVDTRLSTVIASKTDPDLRVATIEHLMAALHALEIDNALVCVNGPEIPVLDGAAESFAFLIHCAGIRPLETPRRIIEVTCPVRVNGKDGAFAEIRPARQGLSLQVDIDFEAQAIGQQQHAMTLNKEDFLREIAFCRTFVCRKDIEMLQKIGLARGGSLENAIVVEGAKILNPAGLRIDNEFARHKLLDAIGDLYCSGHRLQASFVGYKCGHELNNRLLRAVFADQANWKFAGTTVVNRSGSLKRTGVAA